MTRTEANDISPVSAHPRVTPELIEHYVREGQRLRAESLRRIGRRAWAFLGQSGELWTAVGGRLGRRRRMGRLTTRTAP